MAAGFRIDNETLAISVIIGAAALYYFTRDFKTSVEVGQKRDDDRMNLAIANLDTLERRFDELNISEDPSSPYLELVVSQLTSIAEDTLRLQSKSGDIKGLDDDEKFFTHTADLVRTCRHYLEKNAELLTAKEDHLANRVEKCATRNVALHQHVTQNNFDQRTQQHQSAIVVDSRQVNFQQQNVEMKNLHIANPHSQTEGADVQAPGTVQDLLTHVTNAGTNNQSVLDQQQTNRDNLISNPIMGCARPVVVAPAIPTVAKVLELSKPKDTDLFVSAPKVVKDNHDPSPAAVPVPPKTQVTKPLVELKEADVDMFNQSGKAGEAHVGLGSKRVGGFKTSPAPAKRRKRIPLRVLPKSPQAVRQQAASVEVGQFTSQIAQELDKLRGVKEYKAQIIFQIETMLKALDRAVKVSGVGAEQYKNVIRQGYVDRINKHKKRFGINVLELKSGL